MTATTQPLFDEMAVFVQVVDSGSLSAAGRKLGLPASSVSRAVARLEKHLGGRLLERTTRALSATELGQDVYAACRRMLGAAQEVQSLASAYGEQPTGVIRVSAPVVFGQVWVAPRLPAFLARHPGVNVELMLLDRAVDLIEDGVDVAIRIAPQLPLGLASRRLCTSRLVLLASPGYLASHPAPETPAQLAAHPVIHLSYDNFTHWVLRRGGDVVDVTPAARTRSNNSGAVVAMAEHGGGIGLVPRFAAEQSLAAGRTVPVLADWSLDDMFCSEVHAVYLPGRYLPLKTRAFIDHLVAWQPPPGGAGEGR